MDVEGPVDLEELKRLLLDDPDFLKKLALALKHVPIYRVTGLDKHGWPQTRLLDEAELQMPYVSDRQRRFMHARHPGMARRWDRVYGSRVYKKKKRKVQRGRN